MKTTYSELNKFFGRKVKIKDNREKEWYGVVDNITSAEDNEEDEVPGGGDLYRYKARARFGN